MRRQHIRCIEVLDGQLVASLQRKTPAEKVAMVFEAHRTARLLATAGVRHQQPGWDVDQIHAAVIERLNRGTEQPSEVLRFAVHQLERLNVPYALVGTFASCIWGEARLTHDIEFVVELTRPHADLICQSFPSAIFQMGRNAAARATLSSGQIDISNSSFGSRIVIMAAGRTAWATAQLARRKQLRIFADQAASVAAPEDVILGKLVYYRDGGSELELRDVAGILRVSNDLIDRNYVEQFARRFGVLDLWEVILSTID